MSSKPTDSSLNPGDKWKHPNWCQTSPDDKWTLDTHLTHVAGGGQQSVKSGTDAGTPEKRDRTEEMFPSELKWAKRRGGKRPMRRRGSSLNMTKAAQLHREV